MFSPLDVFSIETWVLLISILVLLRFYLHRRWSLLKNLNIPHDPPSILDFGNMAKFMKSPEKVQKAVFKAHLDVCDSYWFLHCDFELKKKYGKVYGMYVWTTPRIVIWDPEILKHIFIKEYHNFPDRQKNFTKVNGKEMNTFLTTVSGEQWKRVRHSLSPLFSASKLKGMMNIIEVNADIMIRVLMKIFKEKEGRFDVKEVFGRFSMDVICAAAFRVNVNSQEGDDSKEIEMTKKLFSNTAFRNPWVWIILMFPWFENIAAKLNVSIFDKKVAEYYRRLTEFIIQKNQSSPMSSKRVDFMQSMLDSEIDESEVKKGLAKGLTRNEIIGNSTLMIIASYENLASTLRNLVYCVSVYDGVQEKLYDELMQTIEKEGKLTYDGVCGMQYLDLCLKETLRLYTISPRASRYCEKDITIKGLFIPAGMNVDVPTHALGHDEEYWDEPWEFKPERFEDMSKIDPLVYQPFGAGPRNCIGLRFALFEVKVAMCKLLERFEFSPCEDTPKPPMEMTIKGGVRPKKDLFLRVTPRKKETQQSVISSE